MTHTLLANLLLFTRALRSAGMQIASDQSADLMRALELVEVGDVNQVYCAARAMLVTRREHLALFDRSFKQFFSLERLLAPQPQKMPRAPRHKQEEKQFDVSSYMAFKARQFDEEIDISDRANTVSASETVQAKDFAQLTPEELEQLKKLIHGMDWRVAKRLSRRRVAARRGEISMRKMLREAARTGGTPLQLARQTRKVKPRPIVLIADISGSMEKYARVLLLFFHSVAQHMPGVHSFVFGTRLSNISHTLAVKNVDVAIDQAGREVLDWSGGTRIGESLRVFNRRWARRVLRRGAVTLIVSDGWESGDVSVLKREMRFLQHRSHRLIWLNPLRGNAAYEAKVAGMQAALPYIDDFLPIHNLESLRALNRRLQEIP